ncbi:MAG: hypothetical protein J2P53_07145 [Bradyrhizobiaceae bacterium]|nr:hypothetical protein [Bradyrhizobiaceae bacterium]
MRGLPDESVVKAWALRSGNQNCAAEWPGFVRVADVAVAGQQVKNGRWRQSGLLTHV